MHAISYSIEKDGHTVYHSIGGYEKSDVLELLFRLKFSESEAAEVFDVIEECGWCPVTDNISVC